MANPDGIEGIGGDRKFMDALYMYYKLKDDLLREGNNPRQETEQSSCTYYLIAVNLCLRKIQTLPGGGDAKRNYLDWLRWNNDVIFTELEQYEAIPHLTTLIPNIGDCKNSINTVADTYFELSEAEKAISNEYVHAYQRAIRSRNEPQIVYIYAGRLFINYVNHLMNRWYIHKLDRIEVTFLQLDNEADYLMRELSGIDGNLASRIRTTNETYAQFRLLDNAAERGQDKIMEHALILAHKRATESILATTIRHIRETIRLITERLRENLQKTLEATAVLFNPIRYPREGARNFLNFLLNPKESVKEIYNWAKEKPWTCASVVLGGIVIGFCFGGTLLVAGAYATDLALSYVAFSNTTLLTFGAIGTAIGGSTYPIAIAGGKVVQLKANSQQEIAIEQAKEAAKRAANETDGRRIANEVLYEQHKRELFKDARNIWNENIRRMREQERQVEVERQRQINSIGVGDLDAVQSQLNNSVEELTTYLRITQRELLQRQMATREIQLDTLRVREGMNAANRLMENVANITGLPSEWPNDSDSLPVTLNQLTIDSSGDAVN